MKQSKFSEAQIAYALRVVEAETPVAHGFRKIGVSEATLHLRKKEFANLGVAEMRRMRRLKHENKRMNALVEARPPKLSAEADGDGGQTFYRRGNVQGHDVRCHCGAEAGWHSLRQS